MADILSRERHWSPVPMDSLDYSRFFDQFYVKVTQR